MVPSVTFPITIDTRAATLVDQLGLNREFDQMLGFVQQLSGLTGIEAVYSEPMEGDDEPRVVLEAHVELPPTTQKTLVPHWNRWCDWLVRHVSPDASRHFTLMLIDGADDDRQGLP